MLACLQLPPPPPPPYESTTILITICIDIINLLINSSVPSSQDRLCASQVKTPELLSSVCVSCEHAVNMHAYVFNA